MPKVLAVALLIKGQVAANLIQANSVAHAVTGETGTTNMVIAAALALLVAVVILGGVRSIVNASVLAAPVMVIAYLAAGLVILALEPARGAMMAAMIPVIDTLVICTVTGLVVLSSGLWGAQTGADLTVTAFTQAIGGLGRVLILACLVLFAFTTIINWAHFSERCFQFLGGRNLVAYRVVFALITFAGPFLPVALVWSLGDALIGLILAVHLLPLTMIVFQRRAELLAALEAER